MKAKHLSRGLLLHTHATACSTRTTNVAGKNKRKILNHGLVA